MRRSLRPTLAPVALAAGLLIGERDPRRGSGPRRRLGRDRHRSGRPVGLAVIARRRQRADPDPSRVPGAVPGHPRRLPAHRGRLSGCDVGANFASGEVPDLFYVNADYAQEWIDQGLLHPLDEYVEASGFDTSTFFPGYAEVFQKDGSWYGFPKDGNTIAMAYNTDLVTDAADDDGRAPRHGREPRGRRGPVGPDVPQPGPRPRARVPLCQWRRAAHRGRHGERHRLTEASRAAVQWYLDLFANGLGMTASDMGADWCGEALGKGSAAIAFEGGWLDPYMETTFPDLPYAWAEMPVGSSGEPVTISFTVSLLDRRRLAEQGPGLRAPQLPDRGRGHDDVDRGRRRAAVAARTCRHRPARRCSPRAAPTLDRARASCPAGSTVQKAFTGRVHRRGPERDVQRRCRWSRRPRPRSTTALGSVTPSDRVIERPGPAATPAPARTRPQADRDVRTT